MNRKISKGDAREFWRDLMGTIWGEPNRKYSSGIMSEDMIAEYLGLPVERATRFLWACAEYGITERQGGAWVV